MVGFVPQNKVSCLNLILNASLRSYFLQVQAASATSVGKGGGSKAVSPRTGGSSQVRQRYLCELLCITFSIRTMNLQVIFIVSFGSFAWESNGEIFRD